jgi:hypothetical protein
MLNITLVAGLWIAMMLLVLPRVLAHPHAVQAKVPQNRKRPTHRR